MGGGGRSKGFAQKAPSSGETLCCQIKLWSNGNTADCRVLDSNPGRWTVGGRAAAIFARKGFETPTKKSVASCITVRPLIAVRGVVLPTAWTWVYR